MTPERECQCRESTIDYTYGGETRAARVWFICSTHKHDKAALVNLRRRRYTQLQRLALPAPEATDGPR